MDTSIDDKYLDGKYTDGLQVYGQGSLSFRVKSGILNVKFRALNKQDFMERMSKIADGLYDFNFKK